MRRRLAALFIPILALSMMPAAAAASPADEARAQHEAIVAFWTPERMKAAIPRDFTFDVVRGYQPAAKPEGKGGGGGGGESTTTVTGASWNQGGPVLTGTGKVYFTMGGSNYICSGAVVANDGRTTHSIVQTAAHCAYDEKMKAFASFWMFIPEFDTKPTYTCANTQHGCWTAQALVVHKGYADAGGFNTQAMQHDFAFAVVGAGGHKTDQLDGEVASFPLSTASLPAGSFVYAFGYPAAQKYKGNDLVYCAGSIFEDSWNALLTWGMACEMTGGSSGGPWFSGFKDKTGTLHSLNSYGYSGVKNMYGPKFNTKTDAVWNAARSATTNTIVP
jgi:hypothetical protein